MTLFLDSEGPVPSITVRGEVDMSTAHLISELAEHVITRRPVRVILDLSQVTFFSAHGISALLRAEHAATRAKVTLILRDAARASPICWRPPRPDWLWTLRQSPQLGDPLGT
ncbi:STAS domain-containing protein [Micromonospora sp. NPDC000442]|uniref:STAS domain-containing protein n=1 Tax=Micromonospora sp. NPDC000442 TaxID=3364217 RepID=UPI0036C2D70A